MLTVTGLTKRFPNQLAVDNLTFSLGPGQVCGFVGPNGAGKTTTMRMLATLEEPTSGEASIGGLSIYEEPYKVRRMIGFMPDHYGTYPALTVRDYLEFYARAYELDPRTRTPRINEIMAFTGLDAFPTKQVETLSKGMKQRLNLGRALLNDPKVLILDEPAAGLDPRARIEFRYLVTNLAAMGKTVFVSSHILTELAEMCDCMLIIDKGRMTTFGTFEDLQRQMQGQLILLVRTVGGGIEQGQALERWLLERPLIDNVSTAEAAAQGGAQLTFAFAGEQAEIPQLLGGLLTSGFGVVEFRQQSLTMEDVFIQITQAAPEG